MIPYIEIINQYTLKSYAIVEPSECWFELSYYDVGEFELYCVASKKNLISLQKGAFVRIPNQRYLWIITSITYTYNVTGGRMILAKGYEGKYLLNKRIIMQPLELPLNLANAIYKLVNDNLGSGAETPRRITNLNVLNQTINVTIEAAQATRSNLLEYVNNLLKTYKCGSYVTFENGLLNYQIIQGQDLTNNIVFSQSQDNLLSSEYYSSDDNLRTYAEVVSKVEDVEYTQFKDNGQTGINRSELLINSDLSTTYTDADGNEQTTTPTSALYQSWQVDEGQKALADNIIIDEVKGVIDLENSNYTFDEDFFIGDIVKIKDEYFNFSSNSRITKITFALDNKGQYSQELEYGGD